MYSEIARNRRKTVYIFMGFFAIVAGLGWIFSEYLTGGPHLTPFVLAGGLIYAVIMYYAGSKVSLKVNGAREIVKKDDPRLWRIVENLSIATGLPMPKVYVMDDPALNAFATGRNPEHAAVCATTGLLQGLDDNELEGVMAHEMAHVKNYDVRVSMLAFALAAVIALIADVILRLTWFRSGDRNNNQIVLILGLVAAVVAPLVASLIQLAISRRREYLADATGALTTRYPDGLASALHKIELHNQPLKKQNTATAHLFFANPLKSGGLAALFSTHPPLAERIARLKAMGGKA